MIEIGDKVEIVNPGACHSISSNRDKVYNKSKVNNAYPLKDDYEEPHIQVYPGSTGKVVDTIPSNGSIWYLVNVDYYDRSILISERGLKFLSKHAESEYF